MSVNPAAIFGIVQMPRSLGMFWRKVVSSLSPMPLVVLSTIGASPVMVINCSNSEISITLSRVIVSSKPSAIPFCSIGLYPSFSNLMSNVPTGSRAKR